SVSKRNLSHENPDLLHKLAFSDDKLRRRECVFVVWQLDFSFLQAANRMRSEMFRIFLLFPVPFDSLFFSQGSMPCSLLKSYWSMCVVYDAGLNLTNYRKIRSRSAIWVSGWCVFVCHPGMRL